MFHLNKKKNTDNILKKEEESIIAKSFEKVNGKWY